MITRSTLATERFLSSLLLVACSTGNCVQAQTPSCSGNQAANETVSGQNLFIKQGTALHVNMNSLAGFTAAQISDIKAGIESWAGTSGITITFDSSVTGYGVITVLNDSTIDSTGEAFWNSGGSGYVSNQITGGTIKFNPGFTFPCSRGPACLGFDPNAPNADTYLKGLGAHEMGHMLGLYEPADASNPCTQTSNSVMGGQCGTNNNGDGTSPPAPSSITPTACDKYNVSSQSAVNASPTRTNGGGGGGGTNSGGGGGGGGRNTVCYEYDDWDDSSYTLTSYTVCY